MSAEYRQTGGMRLVRDGTGLVPWGPLGPSGEGFGVCAGLQPDSQVLSFSLPSSVRAGGTQACLGTLFCALGSDEADGLLWSYAVPRSIMFLLWVSVSSIKIRAEVSLSGSDI